MTYYPTPEFITKRPIKHRTQAILCVMRWKNENKHYKYNQIKQLLHKLAKIYGTSICVFRSKESSCYIPATSCIFLHNNSIITALHEFAHHLYGSSETIACRWSIWLYAKVFPEQINKLEWKGHMLVRKAYNAKTKSCTEHNPSASNT